jgi:hypothetical protein
LVFWVSGCRPASPVLGYENGTEHAVQLNNLMMQIPSTGRSPGIAFFEEGVLFTAWPLTRGLEPEPSVCGVLVCRSTWRSHGTVRLGTMPKTPPMPEPWAMPRQSSSGDWAAMAPRSVAPLAPFHHLLKLPVRRGETGPEPSQPRRAISSPSHKLHRRWVSGRPICWPCTNKISRPWQSEMYPRTRGSFLKQCHSPLALRQYSLSVSPSGAVSIGSE